MINIKIVSSSIIIVLTVISCNSTSTVSETGVIHTTSEDIEMNNAIQESRKTFNQFLLALSSQDSTNYNFAIKMPFPKDNGDGNEHIWLSDISVENGKIFGRIDNEPEFTTQIKVNQIVEIDSSKISDWNYTHENELMGGYSIKLLRKRMTPEEREEFDKNTGWIIK